MVDIHAHLLPGIDDGAKSMEEALEMARIAWLDGITDMFVTPHSHDGLFVNHTELITAKLEQLQALLRLKKIPLRLHIGAEIHIHSDLLTNLRTGELPTLGNQQKYVLLELPSLQLPRFTDQLLAALLEHGITPIIAHPERLVVIAEQPQWLANWIERGAIAQVTADSLLGKQGKRVQRAAETLIRQRLVHLLASDAHHADRRTPRLSHAFARLHQLVSEAEVQTYLHNGEAIVNGQPCRVVEPAVSSRRKWWFW
ncbi:tyrosine-protein phosphatase [Brevibacillus fulvus]|uniref:Tyrosine-protein phosphatase n=1 Tax=Brevibacillus fulvus TaxID=1125967 RepID=A0A938Y0I4_9BACL|nr:CpsB/CapC family capsule biosynthesis tyrosine phosphatase [Brevibacillus fulvus]MBM7588895.1 protein-tyrosine phosphatase [Brevibacillus fulvus]